MLLSPVTPRLVARLVDRARRLRLVAFTASLAIIAGLLAFLAAPADATDASDYGEICTLGVDGSLTCPSDSRAGPFAPPELISPRVLAQATPAQAASLRRLEQQAVDNTLDHHGLPATGWRCRPGRAPRRSRSCTR